MKKAILLIIVVLFFAGCEIQKTEEEYIGAIEQAKVENKQNDIANSYRNLLKYYPESPNSGQYRLELIDILLETSVNPEAEIALIENDTTKISYTYKLLKFHRTNGDEVAATQIMDSFNEENLALLGKKLIGDLDYEGSVEIHEKYIKKFPESDYLDKVYFLIGFTYSENMGDKEKAKTYFQVIPDKYPESELADDAQWMILNMDKEEITFLDEDEPKDK